MSCGELTSSDCAVAMPVLVDCGGAVAAIEVEVLDLGKSHVVPGIASHHARRRGLARELVVRERDDLPDLIADAGSLPA